MKKTLYLSGVNVFLGHFLVKMLLAFVSSLTLISTANAACTPLGAGSKNEPCECALPVFENGRIKCGPSYCGEKRCMPNGSCCEVERYCESTEKGKQCCSENQECYAVEGCLVCIENTIKGTCGVCQNEKWVDDSDLCSACKTCSDGECVADNTQNGQGCTTTDKKQGTCNSGSCCAKIDGCKTYNANCECTACDVDNNYTLVKGNCCAEIDGCKKYDENCECSGCPEGYFAQTVNGKVQCTQCTQSNVAKSKEICETCGYAWTTVRSSGDPDDRYDDRPDEMSYFKGCGGDEWCRDFEVGSWMLLTCEYGSCSYGCGGQEVCDRDYPGEGYEWHDQNTPGTTYDPPYEYWPGCY